MAHLSFPVCDACEGYGTALLNAITHQRSTDPCPKCKGSGRMRPADAIPPLWEPPAEDGSHDGWLIDPGTDQTLATVPTKPAEHDLMTCDHHNCIERRERGTLPEAP